MTKWLNYLRSCTPDEVLSYIPDTLATLTQRVRNGRTVLADNTLTPKKKIHYQEVVEKLTIQRDFLVAVLRYRDQELPIAMGPHWEDGDKWIEAIFQRHTYWLHTLQATNRLTLPENAEAMAELRASINRMTPTPVGQAVMKDGFDVFRDYDYGDLPTFYKDICVALNAIVSFQQEVWDDVFKTRAEERKKKTKTRNAEKEETKEGGA